jgi:hypothetical protein
MDRGRAPIVRDWVQSLWADKSARHDAVQALVADSGLPAAAMEEALQALVARHASPAAEPLRGLSDLHGQHVALLLAESVPTAPLRAIVLALLRGAASVRVRPARRQPRFATMVVEGLAAHGLPVTLATSERGPAFLAEAVAAGVGTVIAYGSDETLVAIQQALPEQVAFEGRGHGFGVAVVLREADAPTAAETVARDVTAFEQRGCLSPQCVLVEGALAEALRFGEQLARVLLHDEAPHGALEPGEAAAVMQWQGAMAAQAERFWRGKGASVAVLARAGIVGSPGHRNLTVMPCESLADASQLLAPVATWLTCLGIAGPEARWNELRLPAGASPRRVPAGTMQDPPFDGYEDPRPPAFGPRGLRRREP